MENLTYTNGKLYTPAQAVDDFSGLIQPSNMPVLIDHICDEALAEYVTAFTEVEGVLNLQIADGHFVAVKPKEQLYGYT